MKPAAAVQEPICLTEEILALRAWRIPDLIAYQHAYDEWWLAPLDDTYPLVRLNQSGIEMLTAMNGHITVERAPAEIWNENMRPGRPTGRVASPTMVLAELFTLLFWNRASGRSSA